MRPPPVAHDRGDVVHAAARADADERRELRRGAREVGAVARRAVASGRAPCPSSACLRQLALRELDAPRHLVRVDVERARGRVEGDSAPFAAAVHAREEDRALRGSADRTRRPCGASATPPAPPAGRPACASVTRSSVNFVRVKGGGRVGRSCVVASGFARHVGRPARAAPPSERRARRSRGRARRCGRSSRSARPRRGACRPS